MVGGEARTGLFMNWEYIQIRFCQISTILSLEDFIEMGGFRTIPFYSSSQKSMREHIIQRAANIYLSTTGRNKGRYAHYF